MNIFFKDNQCRFYQQFFRFIYVLHHLYQVQYFVGSNTSIAFRHLSENALKIPRFPSYKRSFIQPLRKIFATLCYTLRRNMGTKIDACKFVWKYAVHLPFAIWRPYKFIE